MDERFGGPVVLSKAQARQAVGVLCRAFIDYALLQQYFPDEKKRKKVMEYFFSFPVHTVIRYGTACATSRNLEGIALWMHSDDYPVSPWKLLRTVPLRVWLGLGLYGGSRLRPINDYIDELHQRIAPSKHCYLAALGVDPLYQGRGMASRLMGPMLTRLDAEDTPCYLETLDERNVQLYEHFGFTRLHTSQIPGTGITVWAMLRSPGAGPR